MAGSYRRKTTSGPNGTKRTVTQKQGGGVSSTTSHSAGTGQRTAYTRKANGSVVLTKTHRRADGYVTRETKTIVPKYKPVKHPKPPKMPKLKTSVLKEPKPVKFKPYKAPKQKTTTFKWPTAKRSSSSRVRTTRSTNSGSSSFFTWVVIFAVIYMIFAVLSN